MKPLVVELDDFDLPNPPSHGPRMGRPTLPAPLDLDDMDQARRHAEQKSTVPPSQVGAVTPLDIPFELPEQRFFLQLDDRARRAELLNALLSAGGLPKES